MNKTALLDVRRMVEADRLTVVPLAGPEQIMYARKLHKIGAALEWTELADPQPRQPDAVAASKRTGQK